MKITRHTITGPGIALTLLSACAGPDYFELNPYHQQGHNRFDRPVTNFTEETYGLGATFGWHLGATKAAMRNLASLDVSKSGELTLRDRSDHSTDITITQDTAEAAAEVAADEHFALPEQPETYEQGVALLAWAGAILMLAGAWVWIKKARGSGKP